MTNDNYYASLFSGFEGFGIAAEKAGYKPLLHCEINHFSKQVIRHNYNNALIHDDIRKTDFTIYRGAVEMLFGGFPCQPYSLAGKRKGIEDPRNLWPEMYRAICEIQPPWVIGENVPGLINWSKGMVFEQVQSDLEAQGYEVIPFLLPAAGVGAPHKRERIWFVAYSRLFGSQKRQQHTMGFEQLCEKSDVAYSANAGVESMRQRRKNPIYEFGNVTHANQQHGNVSGHGTSEIPTFETSGLQQYNPSNPKRTRLQKPQ